MSDKYIIRVEVSRSTADDLPEDEPFDDDSVTFHAESDEYASELFAQVLADARQTIAIHERAAPA